MNREWFGRDSREVAVDLLGKVLRHGATAGRIVEVEAYRGTDDPGSHGYRGPTPRTGVMFGPPGHLYVYFSYGMHWAANVVCGAVGVSEAVLVRALDPVDGEDEMWSRRPAARRRRDLCSGPAKLAAALGIDGALDGTDLVADASAVVIDDDGFRPASIANSARIGLTRGADLPWRWYVEGDENVSRARPGRRT